MLLPAINVINNSFGLLLGVSHLDVVYDPGDDVVLKRPLDELMQ